MPAVSMTVNGKAVTGDVEARTLLVQFLRENLRLTGTHVGCDTSQCGACVVHIDGIAAKSCTTLALQCEGAKIITIEGLAEPNGPLHPMQEAFREHHGLQCGFCTPGIVMMAKSLLDANPQPSTHGLYAKCLVRKCLMSGGRPEVRVGRSNRPPARIRDSSVDH